MTEIKSNLNKLHLFLCNLYYFNQNSSLEDTTFAFSLLFFFLNSTYIFLSLFLRLCNFLAYRMLKTCIRLALCLPQRLQMSLAQSRKSGYEICICDNVCMIFISLLLLFPLLTLFTFFFSEQNLHF